MMVFPTVPALHREGKGAMVGWWCALVIWHATGCREEQRCQTTLLCSCPS